MNSTKELTRAGLLLTIVFISFSFVSIILRLSIEIAVLIFACKNINIKYSTTMAILIPLYSISISAYPSILRPYVIFVIASNIVFVAIMNKTNNLDLIIQTILSSIAKIIVVSTSIYFSYDIIITLTLMGLIETTAISCLIGVIMYSKAIDILHSRKILN